MDQKGLRNRRKDRNGDQYNGDRIQDHAESKPNEDDDKHNAKFIQIVSGKSF